MRSHLVARSVAIVTGAFVLAAVVPIAVPLAEEKDFTGVEIPEVPHTYGYMHGVFGYIPQPGHLLCPSLSKMLDACEVKGKCIHYPPEKWKGL